jgi:hypothetical protein
MGSRCDTISLLELRYSLAHLSNFASYIRTEYIWKGLEEATIVLDLRGKPAQY